jgi:hypothetical protein
MQVDHFDPKIGPRRRNEYSNLMLASERSNNAKSDSWPSSSERRAGVRFLDPTRECEFGTHIVEHSRSHKLIARTPAGQYHIDTLDLNSEQLVKARKDRSEEFEFQRRQQITFVGHVSFQEIAALLSHYTDQSQYLIPEFPLASAAEEHKFDKQEAVDAAILASK